MYHSTNSLSYVHGEHENEDCRDEQTGMHSEDINVAFPQCAFACAESTAQTNTMKWNGSIYYLQCIFLDVFAKCNGYITTNEDSHNAYELCIRKDVKINGCGLFYSTITISQISKLVSRSLKHSLLRTYTLVLSCVCMSPEQTSWCKHFLLKKKYTHTHTHTHTYFNSSEHGKKFLHK
jgi:hypothetical protein